MSNLLLDKEGLEFIKGWETFRAKPYLCDAGVWTIGFGHTKNVTAGTLPCVYEKALKWLREDVAEAELAVNRLVKASLTQREFNALVSFTFNVGVDNFRKSTLLKRLNAGDKPAASQEMLRWVYVKDANAKRISRGLVRRRAAERDAFLSSGALPPI